MEEIAYGDMASIRLLNQKNINKKFIVLTTGIINYKKNLILLKKIS